MFFPSSKHTVCRVDSGCTKCQMIYSRDWECKPPYTTYPSLRGRAGGPGFRPQGRAAVSAAQICMKLCHILFLLCHILFFQPSFFQPPLTQSRNYISCPSTQRTAGWLLPWWDQNQENGLKVCQKKTGQKTASLCLVKIAFFDIIYLILFAFFYQTKFCHSFACGSPHQWRSHPAAFFFNPDLPASKHLRLGSIGEALCLGFVASCGWWVLSGRMITFYRRPRGRGSESFLTLGGGVHYGIGGRSPLQGSPLHDNTAGGAGSLAVPLKLSLSE